MPTPPSQFAYNSPQEFWYFNGTPLQDADGAWNIATMGGSRFALPVLRGQNVSVPYRAGQSWRGKYPDSRTVTLTMWADGQGFGSTVGASYPSSDQRLAFNSNIQSLRQLFFSRNASGSAQGQLQRNWYIKVGGTSPTLVTSTALAEIAGSMDLNMNGRTSAGFAVDLLLADPYFYGTVQTNNITSAGGIINNQGEGMAGEGWGSSVASFTVALSAASTVTNTTAGVTFTVGTGPAYPVTVDILNQTVTDSGGANAVQYFTHSGSRLWMALNPGNNSITNSAGTATFKFNTPWV